MINALGDQGHTTFLSPEELAHEQSDISGKFSGIGAQLGVAEDALGRHSGQRCAAIRFS